MDADDTHGPGLILRMTRMIREGHDVVIASRYRIGSRVIGLSRSRKILSLGASLLFRLLLPTKGVTDFTSGFRAYRAQVIKDALAKYGSDFIEREGFACMVDVLLKVRKMPVVFGEVPFILRYDRKDSKSKMDVPKTIISTLNLLFHNLAQRSVAQKENTAIPQFAPSPYMLALLVIFLVGLVLRLANLSALSLWVDEFVHYNRARSVLAGTSPLLTNDNNGILYTLTILPFFKLFTDSVFWARLPGVLFGSGSIILVYLLGKKLVNRYVGLVAALLNAFSLYLIYWSRLARNYAIFEFFFLLFLFVLWNLMEQLTTSQNPLNRKSIRSRDIGKVLLIFGLCVLSHQLTFLAIFSIAIYLGVSGMVNFWHQKTKARWQHLALGGISLSGAVLALSPFMQSVWASVLGWFLPDRIVTWVLPDWERIAWLWESKPFHNLDLYGDVFLYDLKTVIVIMSVIGLIIGLKKAFKPSFYLFSFLVIPFLLMSFVFREPALPNYIIFLAPLVHLAFGMCCYYIISVLKQRYSGLNKPLSLALLGLIPLILVASQIRQSEVRDLVKAKQKTNFVVSKKLSTWPFVNYEPASTYVAPLIKDGDVLFATIPESFEFYLNRDVHKFRQFFYNTSTHQYEHYPIDTLNAISGKTLANLQKVYNDHDRGWLLADYYFDNVMTDRSARLWVFSHMHFHKEASPDGSVRVFSWDKSVPLPAYQTIVEELGKGAGPEVSVEYTLENVPIKAEQDSVNIIVIAENIDTNDEAYVYLNRQYYLPLTASTASGPREIHLQIPKNLFREKNNTVQFAYNTQTRGDTRKGVIIYNLVFPPDPVPDQ